jgi:D-alanyl-D-alanine carboxypeptidase/D-alanyl-D-alanine-endopeptidase (penicillin-binding protein 4)
MMRFFGRGVAAWILVVAGAWALPVWAQEQDMGCGGVAVKAAQSGACTVLARQIAGLVEQPAVTRAHWGIAVAGMDGAPIYSLNEGQLFQPASTAKLFTTAAGIALLGPEKTFETRVVARGAMSQDGVLNGDLELVGGGDANLSGRVLPYVAPGQRSKTLGPSPDPLRYLQQLADDVVAKGLKVVSGDVVGDATYFAWEPYGADWAVDDLMWGYGAPASALSVNDNQIKMTIAPGTRSADRATVTMEPDVSYYTVVNEVWSLKGLEDPVGINREPGSKVIRVYGGIAVGAAPDVEELAILDPAEYAAVALKQMLEARGVEVRGKARAVHWELQDGGNYLEEVRQPVPFFEGILNGKTKVGCADAGRPDLKSDETVLATHTSVPLIEDVVMMNKVSQNLHAEMLLRNLGKSLGCVGRVRMGAQIVRQFLLAAGLDQDDFVFYDGSGLSGHDLVTPRATVRLLQYASGQPWFASWKQSLPVGGVDGSLEGRFTKAPLKGRVFAKTGTLGEARALSGYVECASGRTVIFSIMVGNHAPQNNADREVMDKIVAAIAAAN